MSLDLAIAEMLAALDVEMPAAMLDATRTVADEAAARHPYTNRTGNLQRRTQAGRVVGRASRGLVRVDVLGDTRYGSFVEEGTSRNRAYPYLAPAWLARESDFARIVDEALTRGLERVL